MATSRGGTRKKAEKTPEDALQETQATSATLDQTEAEEDQTDYSQIDYTLQTLVSMVNTGAFDVDITLLVGGMIVTGTLTSGRRMLTQVADDWTEAWNRAPNAPDWGKEVGPAAFLRTFVEKAYPPPTPDLAKGPGPTYIHLIKARCMSPGFGATATPNSPGTSWRVKLSAVDGWTLGRITVADKEE